MMLDRMEGNAELKSSVQLMLAARRLTHSVLLVGEEGLGAGFAARCIAADYLYPAGGAPAEALLRGECCRAVGKPGDRDSGHVETGIVREAISVAGMGAGGKYLVSQVKAMRSEIFNTSLSAEGRAVLLYHVEKMNEESANALLKVMEEPPEGVLFLLTADSLAGVLPTIRSRCVSFAVAPVSPEQCARYCAAQGVDKFFTHGLGHGVGLETHEAPSLNPRSQQMLAPGMIVTVEPGLYYPQWGGIRWEYMILVTQDGCEVL